MVWALEFEARPGKRLALGMSIGKAVFPNDGESYEALMAVADNRMYQDKDERKRTRTGSSPKGGTRPAAGGPEVTTDSAVSGL